MNEQTELKLYDAADVTPEVLKAAEEVEEWFSDTTIDWERFYDKLDGYGFFMTDTSSPAANKIQRHIRQMRRDAA